MKLFRFKKNKQKELLEKLLILIPYHPQDVSDVTLARKCDLIKKPYSFKNITKGILKVNKLIKKIALKESIVYEYRKVSVLTEIFAMQEKYKIPYIETLYYSKLENLND